MEWKPEVHELYEKIIARVPAAFRSMVKTLLHDAAGKKCLERNDGYVNEADLITALFEITPEQFKAESIENLKNLGVDVQKYLEIKEIRDRHKLEWEKIEKPWHPGNYWFTMYLTDRCNQACLHCAADSKRHRPELSTGQWVQIIENLETSLRARGRRGVYIWFGGEAACRDDIRDIIKYCGDRGYFHSISTNGIGFDEELAKFCADNGMSHVFVSLDSTDPAKAAKIRGTPHAFEYAEKAIGHAVKNGLLAVITTTVMKLNIDELEDIKALVESRDAVPYFRAVIKQENAAKNWQRIGLDPDDYKRFYDFKYGLIIDKIREGKAGTLPIFGIYDMVPFMEKPGDDTELTALEWGVGCQACRTISGIDINGDVFPCDYPSTLTLGNVLTQGFEDIMNSQLFKDIRDRKRTGKCASCHHLELCGGGCRVHAECETGDFFAPFSYCWHQNDHQHDI
jgi:radical SAM protein with 4Fe4S-binding SPASM domain